jgi:hypothetical protein
LFEFNEKLIFASDCVVPPFYFNFIVDLRCGVSVFYGRWFSSVFPTVPVLVPPKGSIARSFFASVLSAEQRHHTPKFQVFPLVTSI